MAEIVTNPLPPPNGITYSEKQLATFARKFSKLKAIQPGDVCCSCGLDCDGEGFHPDRWIALRVNGHPLCGRPKCYDAAWDEFMGKRTSCSCGRRATGRTDSEG